jgi:hypothetical protein
MRPSDRCYHDALLAGLMVSDAGAGRHDQPSPIQWFFWNRSAAPRHGVPRRGLIDGWSSFSTTKGRFGPVAQRPA